MLEWLIVGGGIQGTLLSHWLAARLAAPERAVRVLDPHAEPLAEWRRCTGNVGMRFLRSPSVHCLDVSATGLASFARSGRGARVAAWRGAYGRPALALFDAHCRHLIECGRLESLRVRGRAVGLARSAAGWRVETDRGVLSARRVVLALGLGEHAAWPAWAQAGHAAGLRIDHVFAPGFRTDSTSPEERVAVIGGGITAAQSAMFLAGRSGPGRVVLISRHPPRLADFDSDPGWLGPRFLAGFHAESDLGRRREAIRRARNRGSMPHDVASELRGAVVRGELDVVHGEVLGAEAGRGRTGMRLQGRGPQGEPFGLEADRVLLATGFAADRPGRGWLDEAIEACALPLAPCGYPALDPSLRWSKGLYAMGPLAELEVGPAARNIAGARMAAERLVSAA
jgi:cation diffusion facilitator CzcD-associated flavoprotein CzcO